MSVRGDVATYVRERVPGTWTVYPYGRNLDGVTDVTVMVEQTKVTPGAAAGLRTVSLTVTVAVGGTDPAKVEDALEDALYELLDVLDGLPHVGLSADRGVINGSTINAYAVTVEVPARKEQP
jgi:flavin-binding protein dodecin